MYDGKRIICIAACYNELKKIGNVVKKIDKKLVDEILVVDDGSTDGSSDVAEAQGATVLSLNTNHGVGYALREGIKYSIDKEYDIIVIIAGNDKDNPKEIPRLLNPITKEGFDFIQGSRFKKGGRYDNTPIFRIITTRLHALLFSFVTRKWILESSNGFRAFKTSLFKDKQINIWQSWLDKYELEPYLYYKTIKLGYKTKEVPVSKIYPQKDLGYTKMKPITGWWSIVKPLVLLCLGLKE